MFSEQVEWVPVSEACPEFDRLIQMACPNSTWTGYDLIVGYFVTIPWYGDEWTVYTSIDGGYPLDCFFGLI